MMRTDGSLFHIDFGYILGEEPHKAVNEGVGSLPTALPHICTGTGLIPPTSAPGLASTLPHLRRK